MTSPPDAVEELRAEIVKKSLLLATALGKSWGYGSVGMELGLCGVGMGLNWVWDWIGLAVVFGLGCGVMRWGRGEWGWV